jgi:PAP2 superfamily.
LVTESILFSEDLVAGIQEATPEAVLEFFTLVTFLGNTEFFIILLTVYYWSASREKGISLLAVGLTAGVVSGGLKEAFGLPRPPAALHLVEASHYGLPSGHAMSSLLIYGYLLYTVESLTRLQKAAFGFVVISSVSVSRVFIGVHYPADTLAGLAFGGVLLALFVLYAESDVDRTLATAVAVSAPFFFLFTGVETVLFSFGGLVAAVVGWRLRTDADSLDVFTAKGGAALVVGLVVVLGGWTALSSLSGLYVLPVSLLVTLFVVSYLDIVGRARIDACAQAGCGSRQGFVKPGPRGKAEGYAGVALFTTSKASEYSRAMERAVPVRTTAPTNSGMATPSYGTTDDIQTTQKAA